MKYYGIIFALFLTLPIFSKNRMQKWKSSSITLFQEKRILIKRYCKIVIHSFELLSGITNFVVCGCLITNDPRKNPTFAEQCFAYTKLSIYGPLLTIGGIIGLYEDVTTPVEQPSQSKPTTQEHIVHVITHTNYNNSPAN